MFSLQLLTNTYTHTGEHNRVKAPEVFVPWTFPGWLSYKMAQFQLHTSKSIERHEQSMWPVWTYTIRLEALSKRNPISRLQTYPHSSVGTVTRLRAGRSTNRPSIPGTGKMCYLLRYVQIGSEAHPAYSVTTGRAARIMKLTTHLHLTPRLRMCRAIPPLQHTPPWLTKGQLYIVCIEMFKMVEF